MLLLVVCTANVARSPLAASMFASSLTPLGVEVASAGTHARPGHPAAESSQRQARRRGLDLGGHRSQPVTPSLLRDADLVLTMSERHRDQCTPHAAGPDDHLFALREMVRLLAHVDVRAAPSNLPERLTWVAEQAHLARPSAPPARAPEDVHDPIQDPAPAWAAMAATLDELCGTVVEALGATPGWTPRPVDATVDEAPTAGRRRRQTRTGGSEL